MDGFRRRVAAATVDARGGGPRLICHLCAEFLPVSGASMCVRAESARLSRRCATSGLAREAADLQLLVGEGPMHDAMRLGSAVLVPDIATPASAERWPVLMPAWLAAGVRAAFAFPMSVGSTGLGSLDLYRQQVGALDTQEQGGAQFAADHAAAAFVRDAFHDIDEPWDDISGFEAEVHQATGMVQVQLNVSTQDALLALRARAFAADRPLVDLARDVVARRVRFSEEDA